MFHKRFCYLTFFSLCGFFNVFFNSTLLAQNSGLDLRLNNFEDTGRLTLSGSVRRQGFSDFPGRLVTVALVRFL